MKKLKGSKKALIAVGALVVVAAVGGTIAMNRTIFPFLNQFDIGTFKMELSEKFVSPTDWQPCDETEKIVTVKNSGNVDAKVRIKMDESWVSKDNHELPLVKDGVNLVTIEFANDNWEFDDGYYYLKNTLAAGASVDFINKVTFSCQANFGENTMIDGQGNTTASTDDYNGAAYHLEITAQMLQADPDVAWAEAYGDYIEPKTFSLLRSDFTSTEGNIRRGRDTKAFIRSQVLPDASTLPSDSSDNSTYAAFTQISASGETPAYMWYDYRDKTLYWYSSADAVTWPAGSTSLGGLFQGMMLALGDGTKMTDISGLTYFDMHNITSVSGMWPSAGTCAMPDDMSAISHWDMSGLTNLGSAFYGNSSCFKQSHMTALEHWKTSSNLKNISGAFSGNTNITDLSGLKNWDVSGVTYFDGAFSGAANLTDVSAIADWNTRSLTSASGMFSGATGITNINVLKNWDVSHVTNFSGMFSGLTQVTNFAQLANWDVSSGTNFNSMFSSTGATDASVLEGWAVSNDATVEHMFDSSSYTTYPSWYTAERRE